MLLARGGGGGEGGCANNLDEQDYVKIWRDHVSPIVAETVSSSDRKRQVAIVEMLETWRVLTRELDKFIRVRRAYR